MNSRIKFIVIKVFKITSKRGLGNYVKKRKYIMDLV